MAKDYEVHGIKRRASLINTARIDHLYEKPQAQSQRFFLHYGDIIERQVEGLGDGARWTPTNPLHR